MNCQSILSQVGFTCAPLSEGVLYVESPLALAFDGQSIGAYVQELGGGRIRVSDNADTLFCALTHGFSASPARNRKLQGIAGQSGVELSDDGELFAVCEADRAGYYVARLVEAALRVSQVCAEQLTPAARDFQAQVDQFLTSHFSERLSRNSKFYGASGHQLRFPFALDAASGAPTLIQHMPVNGGAPDWDVVYQTAGKMADIRNAIPQSKRFVIVQAGDQDELSKAITALSDSARAIHYANLDLALGALAA